MVQHKNEIIVSKFGGSSVKDAEAMNRCAVIVEKNPSIKMVVISATQNTTNQLEFVAQAAFRGEEDTLKGVLSDLEKKHTQIAKDLGATSEILKELQFLYDELHLLSGIVLKERYLGPKAMDQIYSIGERMSSLLMYHLLKTKLKNKKVELIDARKIIKTSSDFGRGKPQIDLILLLAQKHLIPKIYGDQKDQIVFVTQGFIGKDLLGHTTTLGREGSDYSAALFGEAINATRVEIWTDVPGVFSADPRSIPEASAILEISYDEATALATLGAKVLFPTTLLPAQRKNIPVFVGSSIAPDNPGTIISAKKDTQFKLKAVSLLREGSEIYLSFVGPHFEDEKVGGQLLIDKIAEAFLKKFGHSRLEYHDLTTVSLTFRLLKHSNEQSYEEDLKFAHSLLNL